MFECPPQALMHSFKRGFPLLRFNQSITSCANSVTLTTREDHGLFIMLIKHFETNCTF